MRQASTRENFGDSGSESEESKRVELRPAFDIQYSALHYFRAVQEFQQNMAAILAEHISAVEKATHFWRSGSSCGEALGHARYKYHGKVATIHLWWTNMRNHLSRVSPEE